MQAQEIMVRSKNGELVRDVEVCEDGTYATIFKGALSATPAGKPQRPHVSDHTPVRPPEKNERCGDGDQQSKRIESIQEYETMSSTYEEERPGQKQEHSRKRDYAEAVPVERSQSHGLNMVNDSKMETPQTLNNDDEARPRHSGSSSRRSATLDLCQLLMPRGRSTPTPPIWGLTRLVAKLRPIPQLWRQNYMQTLLMLLLLLLMLLPLAATLQVSRV